jgi:hypothetical protein
LECLASSGPEVVKGGNGLSPSKPHCPMPSKTDRGHRKRPCGSLAVGPESVAGKLREGGKSESVRREPGDELNGVDLLSNLCEVMGLFPMVSDEAIGELVGRMMFERLRGEVAKKRRRLGLAKTRRRRSRRRLF